MSTSNLKVAKKNHGTYSTVLFSPPTRKKFRNRSENTSSSFSTSVEQSREESPTAGSKLEVNSGPAVSPSSLSRPSGNSLASDSSSYHSPDTEHIAKKKRAMFQVFRGVFRVVNGDGDIKSSDKKLWDLTPPNLP